MRFYLTQISRNRKTGPIPVSTTSDDSCPPNCPLLGTDCYARFGPVGILWESLSRTEEAGSRQWKLAGVDFSGFLNLVKSLPKRILWRHNQAGDLPGSRGVLDSKKCQQLSDASAHTRGFTYTHYDPTMQPNASVIQSMNQAGGMTVNLSADTLGQADEYAELGIAPVTVLLPEDAPTTGLRTPAGRVITACPFTTHSVPCSRCQLCSLVGRKTIVGFHAHGTAKKRLSKRLTVLNQ